MPCTISDYLLSVPPTDELVAPLQVQRLDDFESTGTTRSTKSPSGYDIDKID
jgi:hypothetical protein